MILCSAEKGEMEVSACLLCSQDHPPCGYSYPVMKSMLNDTTKESRRTDIHVTDIVGCLRKAWYDKINPTPEMPHLTETRWLGTALHKAIEGSDDVFDSETPIAFKEIVGTADIIYKDGHISDLKSTRWMFPHKLPYGSAALQVNIYAWMLRGMGKPTNSLSIQYIDFSGPSKCRKCSVPGQMIGGVVRCPKCSNELKNGHLGAYFVDVPMMTDDEVESVILDRKNNLASAIAMGLEPAKEPGYLCEYCSHRTICLPEVED